MQETCTLLQDSLHHYWSGRFQTWVMCKQKDKFFNKKYWMVLGSL